MKQGKRQNNQIWMLPVILVLTLIMMWSVNTTRFSIVSLEQSTRCGIQEHIHTTSCYDTDGILRCTQAEHVHKQNCYLLLLEENDINILLEEIDYSDEKSLEAVMANVVGRAVTLNNRVSNDAQERILVLAQEEAPDPEVTETITELNHTIVENHIQPAIVLNESLTVEESDEYENFFDGSEAAVMALASGNTVAESSDTLGASEATASMEPTNAYLLEDSSDRRSWSDSEDEDSIALAAAAANGAISETDGAAGSSNVSTFAVGDSAVTDGRYVNFYVNIDGRWTSVGSMQYTIVNNYRSVETAEMLAYINDALGASMTTESWILRYSANANRSYNNTASLGSYRTTFGSNNRNSPIYVRLMTGNNQTPMYFYTVEFEYPDGTATTQYVRSGTAVTMPAGNYTWTSGNSTYNAGDRVTINGAKTFTATATGPVTWLEVRYDVAFPTVNGVTVSMKPTISGLASTTVTDSMSEGVGTTIRNVSEQEVRGSVNGNSAELSRIIRFGGWRVGNSDVILKPNTRLSWDELVSYASGNYLNLTAVWEYDARQTASFYIRYDSVAVDTDGNITGQDANLYTPELFATYVGNATNYSYTDNERYNIADTTSDNSYGADRTIRALYGERSEGVWLQSFPSDESIFELLKQYENKLSVEGVPVDAEDLNENGYAIRWYVFKSQSDAWHVDGKLVRKRGMIQISKTFAGNKNAIEAAKEVFFIEAYNQEDDTSTILALHQYKSYDPLTDTYVWEIEDVDYGEQWTITEYPQGNGASTLSAFSTETTGEEDSVMMLRAPADNLTTEEVSDDPDEEVDDEDAEELDVSESDSEAYEPDDEVDFESKDHESEIATGANASVKKTKIASSSDSELDSDAGEGSDAVSGLKQILHKSVRELNARVLQVFKKTASNASPSNAEELTELEEIEEAEEDADDVKIATGSDAEVDVRKKTDSNALVFTASNSLHAATSSNSLMMMAASVRSAEPEYYTYSEYIVTDAAGDQSTQGAVQGTELQVTGMTYAVDTGVSEAIEVAFTNIYHTNDAIVLKKQDARTGTSIGGATFQLLQNGEVMHFTYDTDAECYVYDADGEFSELSGTANGYFEIFIDQFSYDLGPITIRELTAPDGYTPVGDVEIGYVDDEQDEIGLRSDSPMVSYHDGVLFISNSTDMTSVTVEKKWGCPETEWRDVTVQLLANGRLVTTLLPTIEPTAVLTSENTYSYTWSELPVYANGTPITWSVRETRIGTERCKEDYTFSNWLVDYSLPVYTYNEDGMVTNTKFTITNDTRRTMLRLTKTDMDNTVQLEGAAFTLQLLLEDGTPDTTFTARTATTGSDGTLLFDNLHYGMYVLTETAAPGGYRLIPEPIFLTIEENGTVTVQETIYAQAGNSAFHIVVKNEPAAELPHSGGDGLGGLYGAGVLLMAVALVFAALSGRRRCRG
ncbi:MAG: hypothetical protein IJ374_01235 [Lachnospiraceae bacterium]|nr:hypothetical protein [Lachnospiraceae bacterium]